MPNLIPIICGLMLCILCECEKTNNPSQNQKVTFPNDCIPRAIIVKESFEKRGIWSRVVLYYYDKRRTKGHAVCVYEYGNRLWTYDRKGSYTIRAKKNDVLEIAKQSESRRGSGLDAYHAKFID